MKTRTPYLIGFIAIAAAIYAAAAQPQAATPPPPPPKVAAPPSANTSEHVALMYLEKQKTEATAAYQAAQQTENQIFAEFQQRNPGWIIDPVNGAIEKIPAPTPETKTPSPAVQSKPKDATRDATTQNRTHRHR